MGGFKPDPGSFYADLLAKTEAAFALVDVRGNGPHPCWNYSKDLSTRCLFFGKAIDGSDVSIQLAVRRSGSSGAFLGELCISRDEPGQEEFSWIQLDRVIMSLAPEISPHALKAATNDMRAALSGAPWQVTRTDTDGIRKRFEGNAETFGAAREVTVVDGATATFRVAQVVRPGRVVERLTYLFQVQRTDLPVEFAIIRQ